jgi:hypothetical protein
MGGVSMKSCLIVGADKIGVASKVIENVFGVTEIVHWNGRRARPPTCLPREVAVVIVLVGYVNHSLVRRVKKLADKSGIPVKYASRGLSSLNVAI